MEFQQAILRHAEAGNGHFGPDTDRKPAVSDPVKQFLREDAELVSEGSVDPLWMRSARSYLLANPILSLGLRVDI